MESIWRTLFSLSLFFSAYSMGTKWERCSLLSSSDRCLEVKLEEIVVKIGKPGTDDDVTMTLCSDYEKTSCCTTPPMKSSLSDDWSTDDTETWDDGYFGACKNKIFKIKEGMVATLRKDGTGRLNVTSIILEMKSKDKKVKEMERFDCKGYKLGGDQETYQTNDCKTTPYTFQKIVKVDIKMGNDGTDDNVDMKVCSDVNDVCCTKKLSRKLRDDWKKNANEVWNSDDFDNCAKILFKIKTLPIISFTKDGDDDMTIAKAAYEMSTNGMPPRVTRVACDGFNIQGRCSNKAVCTHTLHNCNTRSLPQSALNGRGGSNTSRSRPSKPRRG